VNAAFVPKAPHYGCFIRFRSTTTLKVVMKEHGAGYKLTRLHQVRFITKTHGTRFHTFLHHMAERSKMVHLGLPDVFLGRLCPRDHHMQAQAWR